MTDQDQRFESTRHTLESAIALIPRGKHILIGSGAAEPQGLVNELVRQASRFADNRIDHMMTLGSAPYVARKYADQFRHNAYFIGPNVRAAVRDGRADYTPVFLSKVPDLIRNRRLPIDVALIQCSPPDEYGFVNLGVSVDIVLAGVEAASLVIAEVNSKMPVVQGDGHVRMDHIDAWVPHASELLTLEHRAPDDIDREIGRHVANLVDDGSTIQVGIGALPDAILASLHHKKDLGVWTEMVSDGLIDLIDSGAVTGRYKTTDPGRVSASFCLGSTRTYNALHNNPHFAFHPVDVINDPILIGQQHRMVAINSALQVDLTGQVCADSLGVNFYSGIGGQVDFIRGASMCKGGKPVIALRSTATEQGLSRIVATLEAGAGVVTSRGDVHYVVTEYGTADLNGRSIRDRAMALISIAHPDFRGELLSAAKKRHYVFADQIEPRATYDHDQESDLVCPQGAHLVVRPIRETDEGKIADMFYSLSEETVQKRYLAPLVSLPHSQLMRYLSVDDTENVALVLETRPSDEAESEIVGIGRYHASGETKYADVAFLVRDEWQGRGLGRTLFERLTNLATENHLLGFTTEVLTSNQAMLHIFKDSGHDVVLDRDGMTYSVRITFR